MHMIAIAYDMILLAIGCKSWKMKGNTTLPHFQSKDPISKKRCSGSIQDPFLGDFGSDTQWFLRKVFQTILGGGFVDNFLLQLPKHLLRSEYILSCLNIST